MNWEVFASHIDAFRGVYSGRTARGDRHLRESKSAGAGQVSAVCRSIVRCHTKSG